MVSMEDIAKCITALDDDATTFRIVEELIREVKGADPRVFERDVRNKLHMMYSKQGFLSKRISICKKCGHRTVTWRVKQ